MNKSLVAFVGLVGLGVLPAVAEEGRITGRIVLAYTKTDSVHTQDPEGRVLTLFRGAGFNTARGEGKHLDGARFFVAGRGDIVAGAGPNEGYFNLSLGEDFLYARYRGESALEQEADGGTRSVSKGELTIVGGRGAFAGAAGRGTYTGVLMPGGIVEVDWRADYTIAWAPRAAETYAFSPRPLRPVRPIPPNLR